MPIEVNQQYSIDIPSTKKAYIVPQVEWQRLRRLIQDQVPQRNLFQLLWPLFAGMLASMIGVLVGLRTATIVPGWAWTLTWTLAATSFVASVICFSADYQQRKTAQQKTNSILDDMKALEQSYQAVPQLANETSEEPTHSEVADSRSFA